MSITQIDFAITKDLTAAVRSLFDPDKQLPQGSAITFMRLEQIDDNISMLTAYLVGGAWFKRLVTSQGIIGTTYLFDADDLLARVNEKLDVWKSNGLRISQTSSNKMKVECILPNSKKLKLTNNILIGTYGGDECDFEDRYPVEDDAQEQAVIPQDNVLDFFHAISLCDSFSTLRSDTQDRAVWLWCKEGNLYLVATEKGGHQGIAMISVLVAHIGGEDWDLGLGGRQVARSTFISRPVYSDEESSQDITIQTTSDRCILTGGQGVASIPIVEAYHCRALSEGAAAYFFGSTSRLNLEKKARRLFDLQELINALQVCTPQKSATVNAVVLEFEDNKAVLSKRSDSKKSERAELVPTSIEGLEEDWLPIVIDHTYFTDALKAIRSYVSRRQKLDGEYRPDGSFDFEDDEFIQPEVTTTVVLHQASNRHRKDHNFLYLEALGYEGCSVVLMTTTKEKTNDYDESD